jgi:hypothetical protein
MVDCESFSLCVLVTERCEGTSLWSFCVFRVVRRDFSVGWILFLTEFPYKVVGTL